MNNAMLVAGAALVTAICGGAAQERYAVNGRTLDFSTHWTWDGRDGEEIPIRVYSNAEEASLELNGRTVCRKKVPDGADGVDFRIKYEPGELLARGWRGGRCVMANTVRTASAPVALRVIPKDKTSALLEAEVLVCDDAGVVNPLAEVPLAVSVEGPAKLVSSAAAKSSRGVARVALERTAPGAISLCVSSPGLRPAVVSYGWMKPELTDRSFTFASVNVRAAMACDATPNRWDERAPRIVEIAERNGFDVIGLQEAEECWCAKLAELLPGWRYYYQGREKDGKGESASLIWDGSRFELLDKGTFWLSDTPDVVGSVTWGGCPRTATWGKFLDSKTGRAFYVYSTHLDCSSLESREKGMRTILDHIKAKRAREPFPALFCGDMNISLYYKKMPLGPKHPICAAMAEMTESWDASETPHTGPFGSWLGFKPGARYDAPDGQIDHIFTAGDLRVLTSRTVNDRPQGLQASDHAFLCCDVEL